MRRNRKKFSFSLLEIMIVISIVGILSVIAVGSYHDYVIRSTIAALTPLADKVKDQVEDLHNQGTVFGSGSSNVYVANTQTNKPTGLYSITQVQYGCVDVAVDLTALSLDGTKQLIMAWCPTLNNGAIEWNCGYESISYSAYITYLPTSCQNTVASIENSSF